MNLGVFYRIKDDYFFYALVFFLASYFFLPASKMVNNVYYALLALPALVYMLRSRFLDFKISYMVFLWLALLLVYCISAVFNGVGLQYYKHLLYIFIFLSICVFFVKSDLLFSNSFYRFSFWLVSFYVVLSAVFYWLTGRYGFGERVIWLPARMSGPIYTSMLISALFSAALPVWIKQKRYLELLSAFVISFFCMSFILQSRSGIVAMFFVVFVYFAYLFYDRKGAFYIVFFSVFSLLSLFLIYYFSESIPVVDQLVRRADSGRFELWSLLLQDFEGCSYLFGCGADFKSERLIYGTHPINHAHNIFLALLVHTGILALALFLLICVSALYLAFVSKNYWGLYLLSSIMALNFDGSQLIGNPDELWILVLLPIFMIMLKSTKLSQESSR